jgi:large subunit ribosomal protein L25
MVSYAPDRTPEAQFRMSAAPARPKLAAARREITGKKVAYLRRDGKLPAVVFGRGLESDSVEIDAHQFDSLRRQLGANALVDLSVDGGKETPVLVHGVQTHRVTRRPLHVDLYVVRMTEELTVDVPLVSEGVSAAVEDMGGTLMHVIESVRVRALPDRLPQSIRYAIESLATFDDAIHVRDLAIPEDATLLTDGDEVVAKVLPPRVEEEPVVAEAAEGEEAEGEEGAEGAAEGAEGDAASEGGETQEES